MDKLLSIIIPCYNAEQYIDRVMGSSTGQTMDKALYEVIAVDDASSDGTLEMLNSWAGRFPDTVKVISNKENLRQGGARNAAIKQARGIYICFLDADDWMEEDALESFAEVLKHKEYDIVTARHKEDYDFPSAEGRLNDGPVSIIKTFTDRNMDEYIDFDLGFVWGSVYRKQMIEDNEVWFPEHLAYEDIYWQRLIKFYAKKACLIDRFTHHHYNHPQSTMNSRNASHHTDRLTCYEMLLSEYEKRGILPVHHDLILKETIEVYYFNSYYMFFNIMDDIPDVYARIRNTIYRYFPGWEAEYDDSGLPMVFSYMIKLLKKAKNASPSDIQPFKDAILEIMEEQ